MSQAITVGRGTFNEGSVARIQGLLIDQAGEPLQRAQVSTWDVKIFDTNADDPRTPVYELTGQSTLDGTAGGVYFAPGAPETGSGWTIDGVGGNFRYDLDSARLTPAGGVGGTVYMVELTFHAGFPYRARFRLRCNPFFSD